MRALSEDSPDSILGRVVGPYRVVARLGSGGDFPLYEAEHLHLDRKVALRLIVPDVAVSGVLDGFMAKARIVSRIRHENVIGLFDLGEAGDGTVYLAMELPEGPSLTQLIGEQGPIPSARAKTIARQIGAAFLAASRQSLSCEEITTDQIFLCRDHAGAEAVRADFAAVDILGVAAPSAPDGFAPQGSVYALGRLLYHMVVGHPPPPLESDEPPPDPMLSRPDIDIPAALDALIVRALDPDPAKRWPDVASLLHVIGESDKRPSSRGMGAVGTDVYASAEHRAFGHTMFRRPSGRALVAGGVAAAAALSLIVVLLVGRRGQPSRDEAATPVVQAQLVPSPVAVQPPPGVVTPRVLVAPPVLVASPVAQAGPPSESAAAVENPIREPSQAIAVRVEASPRTAQAPSPSPSAARGDDGAPRPPPPSASRVADEPTAQPSHAEAVKTIAPSVTASGDDACAVTLGSRPWSEIWIDGRQAGFTPLIDYPVDCGPHEVVFKSAESHTEKRISIVVAAGQAFKKTVDLAPRSACVVTLGSRPWSEVWIDGRRAGVTPLVEYQLACGKHEVLFRSNDAKVERREDIVVQNGQPLKKVVALVQE